MTLSLYIARRFLWTVGQVFLVLFGILMLIVMIEQLRQFPGAGAGVMDAAHLSLLNVPETLYRILPLVLIMGSNAVFLGLARSSELVVVRAAGRSGLRFLVTPVLAALAIGLFAVAVLNPLVAATSKAYDDLRARYQGADGSVSVRLGFGALAAATDHEQRPDADPGLLPGQKQAAARSARTHLRRWIMQRAGGNVRTPASS